MNLQSICAIYDWVTLKDYERAKEHATNQVVERISRGNTLAQDGSSMERQDLDHLSNAADRAMEKMQRRFGVKQP
jgi:hypothetical protein